MIAGEKTAEDGAYRCQKCGKIIALRKGATLPKCSQCAHDLYDAME